MAGNGPTACHALGIASGTDRGIAKYPSRRAGCDGQRTAQRDIISARETAFEARRQRIVISQSTVSSVKWAGLLLQALCALVAIAMVHSDNRMTCRIALMLFATGIALSVLLIAAYSGPFTGEISVGPELLKQVVTHKRWAPRERSPLLAPSRPTRRVVETSASDP
jgi:hypothetical protein